MSNSEPMISNHTDLKQSKAEKKARRRFRRTLLSSYAWRARKSFIPGALLSFFAMVVGILTPMQIGRIINQQIAENLNHSSMDQVFPFFLRSILVYFFLSLLSASLRYSSALLLQRTGNEACRQMQLDVFDHLQKLPLKYFDTTPVGKIVSRITNDTKAIKLLYSGVLIRLCNAFLYSLGILIALLCLNPYLAGLTLLSLPLVLLIFTDFQRKSSRWAYRTRKVVSEINAQINETIQGMEVIQTLNRESRQKKRFEKYTKEFFDLQQKFSWLFSYSAHNITGILQWLLTVCALLLVGYGSITKELIIPIGTLYVFCSYVQTFFSQINNAMMRSSDLERANGAADHLFELFNEPTVEIRLGDLEPIQGEVSFNHVDFSYTEDPVLKDISFTVPAGETAAFVGATGSGKSTIMNLIYQFYPLNSGEIQIDGTDIRQLPLWALRKQMAIVLQDPFLFTGTLYSNIALDNQNITEQQAEEALREVGGSHLLDRLPEGILSPVSEKGQDFSTGERQLISFARALAQNPRILVLDEATANVDSETEAIIQQGIKRLERDRTTLLIAHRLSTIQNAQQIFVLDHGEIVERGTHDSLMEKKGLYAQLVREQSKALKLSKR